MKISIITVSYNSASTIKDTIESVLLQTYQDIEYIVIDGNSKDGTMDIVRHYEPLFGGKMRWVSEPDHGLYDAMNKGISMATGDVIGILNSDDLYFNNQVISTLMTAFEDDNVDAVTGNLYFVQPNDINKATRFYTSKFCTPKVFIFGLIPAHPTFFVRRKCYLAFGAYDTSFDISADFDLMIRFLGVKKITFRYLNLDMVVMRNGGKSTTAKSKIIDNNRNIIHALKNNEFTANYLLIMLRYFFKILGIIKVLLKKDVFIIS